MADRPIPMRAPEVRAILDGRKAQHREIIKPTRQQREWGADFSICPTATIVDDWVAFFHPGGGPYTTASLPWRPGDRAWVRETWANVESLPDWPGRPHIVNDDQSVTIYRADGEWDWCDDDGFLGGPGSCWRPSTHMSRAYSRLTLLIEDVRVQRLQDISEEDAVAEGISWDPDNEGWQVEDCTFFHGRDPTRSFEQLWSSIHGAGAWDANPWVCALTFRAVPRNIDAIGDDHG